MRDLQTPNTIAGKTARYSLYGVLGIWLAATVVSHDPWRKFDKLRRLDKTHMLIPEWRFFGPRPSMHDNHLLVRDELPDGEFTAWQEVCASKDRTWYHMMWFPGRRAEKTIGDIANEFNLMPPEITENEAVLQLSTPYLTLLNYMVHQVPHHPEAKRAQFMLATSAGHDTSEEPTVSFKSNLHPLD